MCASKKRSFRIEDILGQVKSGNGGTPPPKEKVPQQGGADPLSKIGSPFDSPRSLSDTDSSAFEKYTPPSNASPQPTEKVSPCPLLNVQSTQKIESINPYMDTPTAMDIDYYYRPKMSMYSPATHNHIYQQYIDTYAPAYNSVVGLPYNYWRTNNWAGYFKHIQGLPLVLAKRKGGQVRFSPQQTQSLERRFCAHKYLCPEDRKLLANQLKLSDRQVKTWFQNRRAKWRRSNNLTEGPFDEESDDSDGEVRTKIKEADDAEPPDLRKATF